LDKRENACDQTQLLSPGPFLLRQACYAGLGD
jgi:hypothetical protein